MSIFIPNKNSCTILNISDMGANSPSTDGIPLKLCINFRYFRQCFRREKDFILPFISAQIIKFLHEIHLLPRHSPPSLLWMGTGYPIISRQEHSELSGRAPANVKFDSKLMRRFTHKMSAILYYSGHDKSKQQL